MGVFHVDLIEALISGENKAYVIVEEHGEQCFQGEKIISIYFAEDFS